VISHKMAIPEAGDVTILLVHGACHGSWCWEEVLGPLQQRGWSTMTVDLPLTSLRDDAAVVRAAIDDLKAADQRVLVAAHSYGGVVVSDSAHRADALVFCAGTMPDTGQMNADIVPLIQTDRLLAALEISEDGLDASLRPEHAVPAFYNRCSAEVAARALPRLRPMKVLALNQVVERPAWHGVPSSYIVCTDDYAMAPSYQRACAERLGDYIVIDTDHSLFYSATAQLVERLDELALRLGQPANTESVRSS
jgi:pimeloyl-ACP methyl ester carboxylesterase